MKPWSGEDAAAGITGPLRRNGTPYSGINILTLCAASVEHGFRSASWMTFKQALDLNAHVRKGEKGSLVVSANTSQRGRAPHRGGLAVGVSMDEYLLQTVLRQNAPNGTALSDEAQNGDLKDEW